MVFEHTRRFMKSLIVDNNETLLQPLVYENLNFVSSETVEQEQKRQKLSWNA
jgi:hypothetical protein